MADADIIIPVTGMDTLLYVLLNGRDLNGDKM